MGGPAPAGLAPSPERQRRGIFSGERSPDSDLTTKARERARKLQTP